MAADASSGDRRNIPTLNGNAAKWESFRDDIRVRRLGGILERAIQLGCQTCFPVVRSCAMDVHDHGR